MKFAIKSQSGVNILKHCTLGRGTTESEAWEDAFGPKPWHSSVKKAAKKAWVTEVDEEEEYED
jgi:hypothetical protein